MKENEKRGSAGLAIRAGLWYVVSTFLVRSLSFITTPLFSRLLNKEDYGEFTNFASWQALLIIVTGMELHNTVGRAYYDFKEDFDKYVSSVTIAGCGITLAFYAVFLFGGEYLWKVVSIPSKYVHILFLSLLAMCCKHIYMARERTLYRYKSVAVLSVVNLSIPTLIAVAMVISAPEVQRLSARIYGFYLPSALIGLWCAGTMLRKGKTFRWKYVRYAVALSMPLMAHYLTAYLLTSSNNIVTKLVLGAEAVSTISIASSTTHILTLLLQAVSGAVTTWLMDNLEEKNVLAVRKGVMWYTAGVFVVSMGVILLAPECVWILGGERYQDSVFLMPGMVTAILVQSITTVFTIMLTFQKKVLETAVYTGLVSVLSVVAKFFLLPVMGLQILPIINIIAFSVLFAINFALVRRYELSSYVPLLGMVATVGVTIVLFFASFFLYEHILARYCVIGISGVVLLCVAYRNRRKLAGLITMLRQKREKPSAKTNKD